MRTFEQYVNEGWLADKAIRAASKLFRFKIGDGYIDDKMLDVFDNADEVAFQNGEVYMYFIDALNAQKSFKKLANMLGSDISNNKFYAAAGAEGTIEDYDHFKSLTESELTDTQRVVRFFNLSIMKLMQLGYTKIPEKIARKVIKEADNNPLIERVFTVIKKIDKNQNEMWMLGPRDESIVFKTMNDVKKKYPKDDFTKIPVSLKEPHKLASEKNDDGHVYVWVKNGNMTIDRWELFNIARFRDNISYGKMK